ncbi:hypothetical protein I4F81_008443 [Pyropia yezoensis]|uniref:Uncharacterized protein n=1 Tax=Pyropia yezoensis TaxID=2788 RepID=A0ACC3C6J0_PYRYE|nr:hypothetical protein I4F81_008443 [Neopyropia yezoensis]
MLRVTLGGGVRLVVRPVRRRPPVLHADRLAFASAVAGLRSFVSGFDAPATPATPALPTSSAPALLPGTLPAAEVLAARTAALGAKGPALVATTMSAAPAAPAGVFAPPPLGVVATGPPPAATTPPAAGNGNGTPSPPTGEGPAVSAVPDGYTELTEGRAKAVFPTGQVFYNPAQVVNRDLSILTLRHTVAALRAEHNSPNETYSVLEGLAASGLRSLRYHLEVPGLSTVTANDMDPAAVETITRNVAHNGVSPEVVVPSCADAVALMASHRAADRRFSAVDLDPYGSAAFLLDAAVTSVADGGLLAVTCTDLGVLCGNQVDAGYARYGAAPMRGAFAHEMAVRLVVFATAAAAARHGRSVTLLLGAKIDFYVRIFVRLRDSKVAAKERLTTSALVHVCSGCHTPVTQPLGGRRGPNKLTLVTSPAWGVSPPPVSGACGLCGGKVAVGGPIYTPPLCDPSVVRELRANLAADATHLAAADRIEALLALLAGEAAVATPLFLHLATMCKVLRCNAPPAASVRVAVRAHGYAVALSHTDPQAVKTDAPPALVWEILVLWVAHTKGEAVLAAARAALSAGVTAADTAGAANAAEPSAAPTAAAAASADELAAAPSAAAAVDAPATVASAADAANPVAEAAADPPRVTPGQRILARPLTHVQPHLVDWSVRRDALSARNASGAKTTAVCRFPANPTPFWGPKARAHAASPSGTGGGKRGRPDAGASSAGGGAAAPETAAAESVTTYAAPAAAAAAAATTTHGGADDETDGARKRAKVADPPRATTTAAAAAGLAGAAAPAGAAAATSTPPP